MGIRLNKNGKLIVISIGLLMLSCSLLFQNCSPTTLDTSAEKMYRDATVTGDSSYRLPAEFNQTLNTGVTCNVSVNSTSIPIGGTLVYSFTTTGVLPAGYRVYTYGSKNGVPDASEITPSYFQALSQTFTNPGYVGGNYSRYFQIRDNAGRVLCQTNTVSVDVAGTQCTLSTPTPVLRQGFAMVLNIAYGVGTTAPTAGSIVRFNGTNNGLAFSPVPYDQTSFTQYSRVMAAADAGNDYVRYITIHNADDSIYCMTNSVRISVLR